jgi:hypothetical protein
MQKRTLLPILLAATLIACGEKRPAVETPKPVPPAAPADTQAAPAEPQVIRRSGATFADSVHDEYSYAAVSIPRRVSDSIIKANKMDPHRIERAMTGYLHHQDTLARQALAVKYGISLDSLNMILKKKQAER